MKFTVTSQPIALFPSGQQEQLSIINDGPSTVYLDGDSAVSPGYGYALPPSGTMTWRAGKPLWATTEAGEARVTVNLYGNISDASRAETNDVLLRGQFAAVATHVSDVFECGSYQSLFLQATSANAALPALGQHITWTFTWYDGGDNGLITESMIHWSNTGVFQLSMPVKGIACQVTMTSTNAYSSSYLIHGTSRTLLATQSYYPPTYNGSNTTFSRGAVSITAWDKADVYLPSWGGTIRFNMTVNGPVTSDEAVVFNDVLTGETYATAILLTSASSFNSVTTNVIVPRSRGIVFKLLTAPWADVTNVSFNWSDYQ